MEVANITWGEERIADELLVKLGLQVSPRTIRKYMPARRSICVGCCANGVSTTIKHARIHHWDPMSLSRRAIFPSLLLRQGNRFQLDSVSFPSRFSARSITIIGWHTPPDRAKPSDAALPTISRRFHSTSLSTSLNAA
jgi:hypothetical protein